MLTQSNLNIEKNYKQKFFKKRNFQCEVFACNLQTIFSSLKEGKMKIIAASLSSFLPPAGSSLKCFSNGSNCAVYRNKINNFFLKKKVPSVGLELPTNDGVYQFVRLGHVTVKRPITGR
jgi:hypothetical protein